MFKNLLCDSYSEGYPVNRAPDKSVPTNTPTDKSANVLKM